MQQILDSIHIDDTPMFEVYQLLNIFVNNTCYFFGLILNLLNNLINMLLNQINNLILCIQNFELVGNHLWLIQYLCSLCVIFKFQFDYL